jgi:hypothetical protein
LLVAVVVAVLPAVILTMQVVLVEAQNNPGQMAKILLMEVVDLAEQ